jgi:hypothetical protein
MFNDSNLWSTTWGGVTHLAQVLDPSVPGGGTLVAPPATTLVFSSPQFFIALISGIVLAFGFQLLLTNLSVAAGISYLGQWSKPKRSSERHRDRKATVQAYRDPAEYPPGYPASQPPNYAGSYAGGSDHHSDAHHDSSGGNKIKLAAGLWTVLAWHCFLLVF